MLSQSERARNALMNWQGAEALRDAEGTDMSEAIDLLRYAAELHLYMAGQDMEQESRSD